MLRHPDEPQQPAHALPARRRGRQHPRRGQGEIEQREGEAVGQAAVAPADVEGEWDREDDEGEEGHAGGDPRREPEEVRHGGVVLPRGGREGRGAR